jgi:hypothetical protein
MSTTGFCRILSVLSCSTLPILDDSVEQILNPTLASFVVQKKPSTWPLDHILELAPHPASKIVGQMKGNP